MSQDFPLISKDLLDRLNELFPNALPQGIPTDDDIRSLICAVGSRMVINRLQLEYDRQNKLGPYQEREFTKAHHSFYKLSGL